MMAKFKIYLREQELAVTKTQQDCGNYTLNVIWKMENLKINLKNKGTLNPHSKC